MAARAAEASEASPRSRGPRSKRNQPKRYGHTEPRIYTPPLRELTPETSLGFHVIDFAAKVLLVELLPWQKWLLVHMLELRPDNTLRFRTVIVLVARQNGKSTLSQVVALWFLYVYGIALVIGTAQDLDVAEEIWQGAVDMVLEEDDFEQPVRPDLHAMVKKVVQINGKRSLVIDRPEGGQGAPQRRYKVKAANRRAGRSLSGDLILLDELREHQSWDAWGAITKTTMARDMALILCLSNAGDATSIVLRYLRKLCHAVLGDPDGVNAADDPSTLLPTEEDLEDLNDVDVEDVGFEEDDDSLAIFEWSAPPGCDVWDRDGWAYANPSLGYTITERTIASAARTDPEWVFRVEVLCQWSEGSLSGPFPPGSWEASADGPDDTGQGGSKRDPDSEVALCVDVSWDRSTSWIGLASWRPDGLVHVELIAQRHHTDWVIPWLNSLERSQVVRDAPVVIQEKGAPASSLIDELEESGRTVVRWGGSDLGGASGKFYDRVASSMPRHDRDDVDLADDEVPTIQLRHRNQPALNLAAGSAVTKPLGDTWVWDRRRSPVDAAPLIAITGAVWLLTSAMPTPTSSAYEDDDLLVV